MPYAENCTAHEKLSQFFSKNPLEYETSNPAHLTNPIPGRKSPRDAGPAGIGPGIRYRGRNVAARRLAYAGAANDLSPPGRIARLFTTDGWMVASALPQVSGVRRGFCAQRRTDDGPLSPSPLPFRRGEGEAREETNAALKIEQLVPFTSVPTWSLSERR